MMDSDLQHPVSLIPELIKQWELGFDIVCAVREDSKGEGFLKRLTSRGFYYLINLMSKVPIKTASADFRLMSRTALDAFLRFGEVHRFIRGMVSWMGFKVCELPFVAEKRRAGRSKYSLRRMISFALEGITSFSTVPLRISAIFGLFVCLLSFLYSLRVFIVWLIEPQKLEKGWPSLLVSMHFLGGLILISLGIIGEYIGRIYEEVKRRPIYLIREREGFE
jgi:dolichol-phosphate mannosyltransferase